MNYKALKTIIIPILLLLWISIIFKLNTPSLLLDYECCNENKYLDNYTIMLINTLIYILHSASLILAVILIKMNDKIFIIELKVVIIFSFLAVILSVIFATDDPIMLIYADTRMQDTINCILSLLTTIAATIKLVKTSRSITKESSI